MKDKAKECEILWCSGLLGGREGGGGTFLTCATSVATVRNVLLYRAKTTNYQHDIQNKSYELDTDWHLRSSYCPCLFYQQSHLFYSVLLLSTCLQYIMLDFYVYK